MNLQVKKIPFNKTFAVRHPVLRAGKPVETCYFEGDELPTTTHFGLFLEEKLLGVLSVFKNECPIIESKKAYQYRGMAILAPYQNKKYGVLLLDAANTWVAEEQGDLIWFNAREKAIGFYKRNGFTIFGTVFDIANIGPHVLMFKYL
ncbi:GNAT family N-acetyltransferase [Flavobacterium sp. 20NA77.7]|uniref:GNAT family N-acetyltransferase n=1 Tax=Flavobacterium nakdongensis TaxID=3073563 RepID=A0ABY9RAL9_9FLAO|nr:GNAT family N-acetyltransferase [Flavobacterium sp. 20NA77.7]WMW78209.1 GNAT family N-acetyltransferase [Flavobacterium sp. 20NA77.7]